jgi:hypothetical protein
VPWELRYLQPPSLTEDAFLAPGDIQRIGLGEILARLMAYKAGILSQWRLLALWAGYLIVTGGLVGGRNVFAADNKTPDSTTSGRAAEARITEQAIKC